jgi:hypothetical protein
VFHIEGPGGVAEWDPPNFPANTWNHFAVPIDEAAWNVVAGNWSDILVNVTTLSVAAEMISGDETVRLDNIRLGQSPNPVFVVCALNDFEFSAVGWTAVTASATLTANDGDPGDYLRIHEAGAGARLVLPAW